VAVSFTVAPQMVAVGPLVRFLARSVYTIGRTRSWIPKWADWVLPWTLIKTHPGFATVAIDLSSAWASHQAIDYLQDTLSSSAARTVLLLATVGKVLVEGGLAPGEWERLKTALLAGANPEDLSELLTHIDASAAGLVAQFPPMWLADP
jgi:hypothetical protein